MLQKQLEHHQVWCPDLMSITDGLLLSDASLSQYQNSNFRLRIGQIIEHTDWIESLKATFESYGVKVGIYNYVNYGFGKSSKHIALYTSRNQVMTKLRRRWYKNGRKIVPNNLKLNTLTLAHWFMGDGYTSWIGTEKLSTHLGLCTEGFGLEDNLKLKVLLENQNYHFWLGTKKRKGFVHFNLGLTRSYEVFDFLNRVEPFVVPSFHYKIKKPIPRSHSDFFKEFVKTRKRNVHGRFLPKEGNN